MIRWALPVLLLAGAAHAQDADAVKEAPAFMAATGKQAVLDPFIARRNTMAIAMLARKGGSFGELAAVVQKFIMPDLRAKAPELFAQWTAIYASQLSAADMKAIEAFYATPAGQHLMAAQPSIDASIDFANSTWTMTSLQALIARYETAPPPHTPSK